MNNYVQLPSNILNEFSDLNHHILQVYFQNIQGLTLYSLRNHNAYQQSHDNIVLLILVHYFLKLYKLKFSSIL